MESWTGVSTELKHWPGSDLKRNEIGIGNAKHEAQRYGVGDRDVHALGETGGDGATSAHGDNKFSSHSRETFPAGQAGPCSTSRRRWLSPRLSTTARALANWALGSWEDAWLRQTRQLSPAALAAARPLLESSRTSTVSAAGTSRAKASW